jgi:hypothetical protein
MFGIYADLHTPLPEESRYGAELNELRKQMYDCPRLHHIERLDSIGRELGVLRRHYESYTRIVERLLEPQSASGASLQNSQVVSSDSRVSLDTVRPIVLEKESMLGVALSSASRVSTVLDKSHPAQRSDPLSFAPLPSES